MECQDRQLVLIITPIVATFLQLYKLLSVYSIIKSPKSGNCTILDSTQPNISMNDIKKVFSKNDTPISQLKVDCLKKWLDALIAQEIKVDSVLEVNNFNDHDYYKSDTESCILYYICGYVTRHINKYIKCSDC